MASPSRTSSASFTLKSAIKVAFSPKREFGNLKTSSKLTKQPTAARLVLNSPTSQIGKFATGFVSILKASSTTN